jgi:hypothetical protein
MRDKTYFLVFNNLGHGQDQNSPESEDLDLRNCNESMG